MIRKTKLIVNNPFLQSSTNPSFKSGKYSNCNFIYVLEGTLEYQIETKPVMVKSGVRPDLNGRLGKERRQRQREELATYAVEKGKPLIALVK